MLTVVSLQSKKQHDPYKKKGCQTNDKIGQVIIPLRQLPWKKFKMLVTLKWSKSRMWPSLEGQLVDTKTVCRANNKFKLFISTNSFN